MTFSIMTFSIMAFSIMTFSIMAFSIMTFSIMTFSIMAFSIMTRSKCLYLQSPKEPTLRPSNCQDQIQPKNNRKIKLVSIVVVLSHLTFKLLAERHSTQ
jgi:hypothetical protein